MREKGEMLKVNQQFFWEEEMMWMVKKIKSRE